MSTSTQFPKKPDDKPFYALLLLAALILYLCLTSCMTNRHGLTERGKAFVATYCKGSDSTVTEHDVIVKDTTIYITAQGETIYLQSPCDSVAPIIKVKNGIKSTVLSFGKSKVFICEADSLRAVISSLERRNTVKRVVNTVVHDPCGLEHLSGFRWFLIYCGWGLLGFVALQLIVKCLMTVYPVTRPFITWLYWMRF